MKTFIKKNKKHIIYICVLILILCANLNKFLINFKSLPQSDLIGGYSPKVYILRESIKKYHHIFPLWNPYAFSGTPLFANPNYTLLYYTFPLIIPHVLASLKMTIFFSIILGGIFMYILAFYLLKDSESAFIASLIYMINPWINSRVGITHLTTIAAYAYAPIIIFFAFKALKSKKWFSYSIITGILFALQILSGPDLKVTLWTAPIFLFCLLFYLVGRNLSKRIVKTIFIGSIVGIVCFGLIAFKALPSNELLKIGSRSEVPFESTLGGRIHSFNEFFPKLIQPLHKGGFHIGIIPFLLILFAIIKGYKNKNVLLFSSVIIFFLFIVTGSFVWYLIWKYLPLYHSFRFLHRTPSMFVFAGGILTAYGFYEIKKILIKKGWSNKKIYFSFIVTVALIVINLFTLGSLPYRSTQWGDPAELLKSNYLLQNLSKEPGIFRMHVYETNGIDWGTDFQHMPLGLKSIYAYESIWLTEYMNVYLSVAYNDRAKFWGMLNTKFITSTEEINISGLRFYKKFENCTVCWPEIEGWRKAWGPYLYINEKFLPVAYTTNNAILIVGEDESAKQLMYGLMIHEKFDPKNLIFILGKQSINDYESDELKDYKAIILGKNSIDQNSVFKLDYYIKAGGILIPDITKGRNQISENDFVTLWSLSGNYTPIEDEDVNIINFDYRRIKLPRKDGFLVLSEQFSMYPGWKAFINKQPRKIIRANGVLSAVKINKEDEEIIFEYQPKSFIIGLYITIITITLIIYYFSYAIYKNKKGSIRNAAHENTS